MIILGLTGGIGMGKSTAAAAFRRARIPVFDADAAVHRLQARGGRAVRAIAEAFPGAVRDGAVDRSSLRHIVLGNPDALTQLEGILHLWSGRRNAPSLRALVDAAIVPWCSTSRCCWKPAVTSVSIASWSFQHRATCRRTEYVRAVE
jgi:dephospho-CoA kinase